MTVERGERKRLKLPVSRLPTETWLELPVEIVHGAKPGPRMWLSATVHGDELNGVEIIRRVLQKLRPDELAGTIIAVPIVNVFGFINQSRYLPDRRDLNRSFPGSARGSMASRLAHLFMSTVVSQCSYGIDLHTGSNHRTNLPQIRADLSDPETLRIARAFRAPVIVDTHTRDGSLREAASKKGICTLLYEGGEPLRFDQEVITVGVEGILRVMAKLKMRTLDGVRKRRPSLLLEQTNWVRARRGGVLRLEVELGQIVKHRQRLGVIADSFGEDSVQVRASAAGMVIGLVNNPLVNQGDAVVHIGGPLPDPDEPPPPAE